MYKKWSASFHFFSLPKMYIWVEKRGLKMAELAHTQEPRYESAVKHLLCFIHHSLILLDWYRATSSHWIILASPHFLTGCPRGVMVKAMDCGIVVREFVLQSRYYVHFRANTLGKGMNPLILPASTTTVLIEE